MGNNHGGHEKDKEKPHARSSAAAESAAAAAPDSPASRRGPDELMSHAWPEASEGASTISPERLAEYLFAFPPSLIRAIMHITAQGKDALDEAAFRRVVMFFTRSVPPDQQCRYLLELYCLDGADVQREHLIEMMVDSFIAAQAISYAIASADAGRPGEKPAVELLSTERGAIERMVDEIFKMLGGPTHPMERVTDYLGLHLQAATPVFEFGRALMSSYDTRPLNERIHRSVLIPIVSGSAILGDRVTAWRMGLVMRALKHDAPAGVESMLAFSTLFSSTRDGTSMNRLETGVFGYRGPTSLLVQDTRGNVFGATIPAVWTPRAVFQGTAETTLFALHPVPRICRALASGSNYFYYATPELKGRGKAPSGIGFGGQLGNFRLSLNDDLDAGRGLGADATYEAGFISPDAFQTVEVEVIGYGGTTAAQAQAYAQNVQAKWQEQMRKVDRAKLGDGARMDNPDMAILEMGGVHRSYAHGARDRVQHGAEGVPEHR